MAHQGVEIVARELGVGGARGAVFAGVELAAAPGQLVAIAGPGGSGRTSLLLTLAGRMRPTHGSAEVGGRRLPQEAKAVRRLVTVARATGAVELQDRWTVQEAVDLQEVLRGHRIDAREAAATLDLCGISARGEDRIEDLHPAQRTRLAAALAWFEGPPATVVDDVDRGTNTLTEAAIWQVLRGLADRGTTVLASTADATAATAIADVVVTLKHPSGPGAPGPANGPANGVPPPQPPPTPAAEA
jgi:ABC-type multidrug transport system ATPase subunit